MSTTAVAEQLKFPFGLLAEEMTDPIFGHQLTEIEAFIASLLIDATSEKPMKTDRIIELVKDQVDQRLDRRKVKIIIRNLRRNHAFPILTRRSNPAGYFWCHSQKEMEEFERMWLSQVYDELITLQIMKKHNYPRMAKQLRFKDIPNPEGNNK